MLLFISVNCYSQATTSETITISNSKLKKMTKTEEIIAPLSGCDAKSCSLIYKVRGKLVHSAGSSENINETLKNALKQIDKGSKLYIDMKYKCSEKIKTRSIVITLNE